MENFAEDDLFAGSGSVAETIVDLRNKGHLGYQVIADMLNASKIKTPRRRAWTQQYVRKVYLAHVPGGELRHFYSSDKRPKFGYIAAMLQLEGLDTKAVRDILKSCGGDAAEWANIRHIKRQAPRSVATAGYCSVAGCRNVIGRGLRFLCTHHYRDAAE